MTKSLPPFSYLLAFDAAARRGTFTQAARDLNVSQPAISRRVGALEADLGVALFSRETKPLSLTADGERLFAVLRSGLSRLEAEVLEIRERKHENKLTVSAAPGFLAFWLVPRLDKLTSAFEHYELSLTTNDQLGDASRSDVRVRFGAGTWANIRSKKILSEEVFAVCSPILLKGRETPLSVAQLSRERLLQLSDPRRRWYDWRSWFETAGLSSTPKLRTLDFDSYSLLISAALAGQGVALGWAGLLERHLETGALLRVSEHVARSNRGYYATCSVDVPLDSATSKLIDWLSREGSARTEG